MRTYDDYTSSYYNFDYKPNKNKIIHIYDYKKIFMRFMKEFKLYDKYIINISKSDLFLNSFKNNEINETNFIMSAFNWKYSNEGFDFWMLTHSIWTQIIYAIKYNDNKLNDEEIYNLIIKQIKSILFNKKI